MSIYNIVLVIKRKTTAIAVVFLFETVKVHFYSSPSKTPTIVYIQNMINKEIKA